MEAPKSTSYFSQQAPKERGQRQAASEPTRIGHMTKLNIYSEPDDVRRTSIVCTIGPKTGTVPMLTALRRAGMNIMRLNFSHGSHEFHGGLISNLRQSVKEVPGAPVAIALDTKGPEIRTGLLPGGDVKYEAGDLVTLHLEDEWYEKGTKSDLYVDYKNLASVIMVGGTIFMDDGLLSLEVLDVSPTEVRCRFNNSGVLGSRKGCNLPNVNVDLPAVSEKDISDLRWGVQQGVDMVFASFIRKASDVRDIRHVLGADGANVKIIAKIENHEGIRNFPEILKECDGVMVARGDMGIEVPPEKVFVAQKMIISMCNVAGKPVICATQMLESMTYNPRPTRAEVSDVANAVLDGADCVMLSGETAKGDYPVDTATMMGSICREAEAAFLYQAHFEEMKMLTGPTATAETIAVAAVEASYKIKAAAIICLTTSGYTAYQASKYRPRVPILMVTRDDRVARQGHLGRGIYPLVVPFPIMPSFQDDVDSRIDWTLAEAKKANFLRTGELVVCVQGWRGGVGHTNTMRILVVP